MSTIRDDLEGVVIIATDGNPLVLKAGDTVPDGVELGDHVLADDGPKPYTKWKVDELRAEVTRRNEGRDVQIPDGSKAELAAALEADDAR